MPLPIPEPGLVLCYEFLWSNEHLQGQEQGQKKRPAVVVLKTRTEAGQTSITVAPVTHAPPPPDRDACGRDPAKGQGASRPGSSPVLDCLRRTKRIRLART